MKARLTITLNDDGTVRVDGPLGNPRLFQNLLRAGFGALKEHQRKKPTTFAPPFKILDLTGRQVN
jgi:hypothetical protein